MSPLMFVLWLIICMRGSWGGCRGRPGGLCGGASSPRPPAPRRRRRRGTCSPWCLGQPHRALWCLNNRKNVFNSSWKKLGLATLKILQSSLHYVSVFSIQWPMRKRQQHYPYRKKPAYFKICNVKEVLRI